MHLTSNNLSSETKGEDIKNFTPPKHPRKSQKLLLSVTNDSNNAKTGYTKKDHPYLRWPFSANEPGLKSIFVAKLIVVLNF